MHVVKVQLEGPRKEEGHVRLDAFVQYLTALRGALTKSDSILSGVGKPTIYYRIIGLSHSSPITVEIEMLLRKSSVDCRRTVLSRLITAIEEIQQTGRAPDWVDTPLLETLERTAKAIGSEIDYALISGNGSAATQDQRFRRNVKALLAPGESCIGSVQGDLLAVDLHGRQNIFYVYPQIGPGRIRCIVPQELKDKAVRALEERVEVRGTLLYPKDSFFPTSVEATEISVLEPTEISLFDLRGVAPQATGELSAVDFVRKLRSEWQ